MFKWEYLIWMVRWKIPKCQTAHRLLLPWHSTVNISLISYPTRWYSHEDVTTVGKNKQTFRQDFIKQSGISGLLQFKPNSTLNIMPETIFLKKKEKLFIFLPSKTKWPSSTRNIPKERNTYWKKARKLGYIKSKFVKTRVHFELKLTQIWESGFFFLNKQKSFSLHCPVICILSFLLFSQTPRYANP